MSIPTNQNLTNPPNAAPYTMEQARAFLKLPPLTTAPKDHAYSKLLAERYGIPAALALKYLAYCVSKSMKTDEEGRQVTMKSIQEIAGHYPYLSGSAIHAALKKVPADQLIRKVSWSRKTRARPTSYALSDELASATDKDLIYFSPTVAQAHGITTAAVLHRIQYEIRMKQKKRTSYRFHPVSATELVKRLGLSRATVSRALGTLAEEGFIGPSPDSSTHRPEFEILERPVELAKNAPPDSQNRI